MVDKINKLTGIKELDTGISLPSQWNLAQDSKRASEQPLQVARCNKIIEEGNEKKYRIVLFLIFDFNYIFVYNIKVAKIKKEL